MPTARVRSFQEFWPYYVRAHLDRRNRALHYVGTSCALGCVTAAVFTGNLLWLLAAPVAGYGPAWFGHFVIEGNRPATFDYFLYSLRGDFVMLGHALRGSMAEQLARAAALRATERSAERAP